MAYTMTATAANAVAGTITAGIFWIFIVGLIISLAVFSLFVAVGTYIVKKVWFSDWGGNPKKFR